MALNIWTRFAVDSVVQDTDPLPLLSTLHPTKTKMAAKNSTTDVAGADDVWMQINGTS